MASYTQCCGEENFSKWNRIHTNDANAWSIGSNRASDRHKTTMRRRREKNIGKKRWRKHRNQYQCNRVLFLSNVLFKSLLLFFLAFGLTLFGSSQLDMVFKWRKSNSFKWIAIIVREEKNSWAKDITTVSKIYTIFSHVVENEGMMKESVFFSFPSSNRIKNWYTWKFKFSTPQNSSGRVLSTYKSFRNHVILSERAHLFRYESERTRQKKTNWIDFELFTLVGFVVRILIFETLVFCILSADVDLKRIVWKKKNRVHVFSIPFYMQPQTFCDFFIGVTAVTITMKTDRSWANYKPIQFKWKWMNENRRDL